jgi:ubiquinone biosynthesis protein COQ9
MTDHTGSARPQPDGAGLDGGGPPSAKLRARLLEAMLEIAPDKGWTVAAMEAAAERAGLSEGELELCAPNGPADLLEELGTRSAKAAERALARADLSGLKIREKVRLGVKAYLGALSPHKAAVKRGAVSPANVLAGPKALWAAADSVWSALGDLSTDYNWYTKRIILSGVIGSTMAVWLEAKSEEEVDAFLDRRIENVMEFEKTKAKVLDAFSKMPNPFDMMGKKPGA